MKITQAFNFISKRYITKIERSASLSFLENYLE